MTGRIVFRRKLNAAGEFEDSPVYFVDGQEVAEEVFRGHFPDKPLVAGGTGPAAGAHPAGWPMESVACAVHASQVEMANARNKRHGVATRYKKNGQAIIPDPGDYKKLLKLEGFHHNNAFN